MHSGVYAPREGVFPWKAQSLLIASLSCEVYNRSTGSPEVVMNSDWRSGRAFRVSFRVVSSHCSRAFFDSLASLLIATSRILTLVSQLTTCPCRCLSRACSAADRSAACLESPKPWPATFLPSSTSAVNFFAWSGPLSPVMR